MLRLDFEARIDKRLFIGRVFMAIFCLASTCLAETKKGRVQDLFGTVLNVLHFNYGTQLSEQDVIKSESLRLKMDGIALESEIFAEVHDCSIGSTLINPRSVRVLFDQQQSMRYRTILQTFEINVQIENPTHAIGPVRCGHVGIMTSTSASPLIEAKIYGDVVESPSWDASGLHHVNAVQFSFSGITSQSRADLPVESQAVSIRLVHPLANPANVQVSRPQSCKIGDKFIRDQDVAIVVGADEIGSDRQVLFFDGQSQTMRLRFGAIGGYGKAHGTVQCEKSGGLIYGY